MGYKSTQECINDLEKHGHLIRIKEEVSSELEMAAIHLRVFENNGPALLFENIKNCKFKAASNLYGTLARSKFIFRDSIEKIKTLIDLKNNPIEALKHPFKYANIGLTAFSAIPKKLNFYNPVLENQTTISTYTTISTTTTIFNITTTISTTTSISTTTRPLDWAPLLFTVCLNL